jgi:hypothetical protein
MRNAIAPLSLLAASIIALGGCDSGVGTNQPLRPAAAASEQNVRYQIDAAHGRIWWLTREACFSRRQDAAKSPCRFRAGGLRAGLTVACRRWRWVRTERRWSPVSGIHGWKIDPDTLAVSMHVLAPDADLDERGLPPSPIRPSTLRTAISGLQGSLWKIDRPLTRKQKIRALGAMPKACGVAVSAAEAKQLGRLCPGRQGDWTVQLASDRPTPCAPRRVPICPGC